MSGNDNKTGIPTRIILVGIIGVILLVIAVTFPVEHWITETVTWFQEHGTEGKIVFGSAYFLAGLILLPIFPLTVFAGVIYGLDTGPLVVLPAATLSATLGGWLGQTVLADAVSRMLSTRPVWKAVCEALAGHGFRAVVLNRMTPLLPFSIQNYALGSVGIPPAAHFWGTLIGIQPAMWTALYIGTMVTTWAQAKQSLGASAFSGPRLYLFILGGFAVLTLMVWLGRVAMRAQKELGIRTQPK